MILDKIIIEFDKIIKNLFNEPLSTRDHPDKNIKEYEFNLTEKKQVIRLMRINHCGEICAQALYQGQSITTRDKATRDTFQKSAHEETEHLAWTKHRITELSGKTSILAPLFYAGSLAVGLTAGIFGDKWNLGFLEETERQVETHLNKHLEQLPPDDEKSRLILTQMKEDEIAHADMAHNYGAYKLPLAIKLLMKLSSKVMTTTTYYI